MISAIIIINDIICHTRCVHVYGFEKKNGFFTNYYINNTIIIVKIRKPKANKIIFIHFISLDLIKIYKYIRFLKTFIYTYYGKYL